ncbi:MAG: nuclear transport factor 2 family protein [Myxococcales bacterium]|nr:nuclear transport factor 2 family protein [Myxococcales bacterium]
MARTRSWAAHLLLASLLWSGGCAHSPAAAPAATVAFADELETVLREMEAAFARGDMAGVAAFYADDAVMLAPGGGRYEGREAIDAYWIRFTEPIAWALESHGIEGRPELAVMRGRSTLEYAREGEAQRSVVEFMLVWQRSPEGRWQIVVDAYW